MQQERELLPAGRRFRAFMTPACTLEDLHDVEVDSRDGAGLRCVLFVGTGGRRFHGQEIIRVQDDAAGGPGAAGLPAAGLDD
jgi:hypothetical protein